MADGCVEFEVVATSKQAQEELDKVKGKAEDLGESAENAGERAEAGFGGVALGAAAVSTALIAATKAAVDYATAFEAAFAKTQTIMDTNVMSTQDLKSSVLDLSQATGMAAIDVSEAVYQAISGSVDTAAAVGFVDKANRLAVAGFTSLTNATDVLTTTLNAYGMEESKVGGISNVLIKTQNLGKTSVNELSSSMGKAISTGSAYGVNLQNIATGYVELTKGGIATAEATTYLSGMMNELGKSTSTVAGILQEKTGKSFGQLMADGKTLGDVLEILSDSVDGNSEAFMGLWGSQEAGKAANALMVQGVKDFNAVAAQMNDELAGVTGTTDAAYATMTNTSEFIDKQLSNSIANLGIAYGSHLQPALDRIKSGFTEFVEGLAHYVDENPQVVASMTGLAAALAVVAAGYAALQIAQKAAVAVEALNAAMESNPYMAIAGLIATLVVALGTMASVMITEANDAYNELISSALELQEVMTTGKAAMEDQLVSIEATANMSDHYIDRLEALEAAGLKTEDQQREYHNLLVLLAQTVPDLAEKINLETDSIEGGTAALRAQTDAWKENAKAQAYQEYLTTLYSTYGDTLVAAEKSRIKLTDAEDRARTAEEALNQLEKRRETLYAAANEEAERRYRLTGEMCDLTGEMCDADALLTGGSKALTEAYQENEAAIEAQTAALAQAKTDIDTYTQAVADNANAVDAANDEIDITEQAVQNLTGAIEGGTEAGEEATVAAGEAAQATAAWQEAVTGLEDAYTKAKSSAAKSLESQISLVKEADKTTRTSVSSMIANLRSHASYMAEYAANLKRAGELGIDEGLLKHLSDGSVESAGILESMVGMTEDEVAEMNAAWQEVSKGKENLATGLAAYSDEVLSAKNELVGIASQAGLDMGVQLGSKLAAGLPAFRSYITAYENELRRLSGEATRYTTLTNARGYPTTTAYASGTAYASAGYAIVGEEGPELIYLRGGERILNADETRSVLRSVYPAVPASYTGNTAPAITGGGTRQTHATIVVPVQIDGREVARTTAEYMGEEMSWGVLE